MFTIQTKHLRYKKFVREYMSNTLEYNQHLIASHLIGLAQFNPDILNVECSELVVSMESLFPELIDKSHVQDTGDKTSIMSKVLQLVRKIDSGSADKLKPTHLQDVGGMRLGIMLHHLVVRVRDLPLPVVQVSLLSLQARYVQLQYRISLLSQKIADIYGDQTMHIESRLQFKKLQTAVGINLLAELKSVSTYLTQLGEKFAGFVLKILQAPDGIDSLLSPEINHSGRKPARKQHKSRGEASPGVWDKMRFKYHFNCEVEFKHANLRILTGVTPYQQDSLDVTFESLQAKLSEKVYSLLVKDMRVKRSVDPDSGTKKLYLEPNRNSFTILKIPEFELLLIPEWGSSDDYLFFIQEKDSLQLPRMSMSMMSGFLAAESEFLFKPRNTIDKDSEALDQSFIAKELKIEAKVNIPRVENVHRKTKHLPSSMEDAMEKSDVPLIHMEANLLDELTKLPQMRHEYLLLHGIKTSPGDSQDDPEVEDEESDSVNDEQGIKHLLKHSNYVELLKHKINEQLNTEEDNIAKFVSQVDFCSNTTSLRLIFTNSQMKVEVPKNSSKVIGLQTLIESTTYSSRFVTSDLNKKLGKTPTKKSSSKLVWEVTDAKSDIRLFVTGYLHEDLKLLKFEKNAFEAYKRMTYQSSMDNRLEFSKFFNLSPERTSKIARLSPLRQFSFRGTTSIIPIKSTILEDTDSRPSLLEGNAAHIKEVQFESFDQEMAKLLSAGLIEDLADSDENPNQFLRMKSYMSQGPLSLEEHSHSVIFNFDEMSVFMSVMLIKFEQGKLKHLKFEHRDPAKCLDEQALFKNFVTLMGSKILITNSVFKIITQVQMPQTKPKKDTQPKPASNNDDRANFEKLYSQRKFSADEELGTGGIRKLDPRLRPLTTIEDFKLVPEFIDHPLQNGHSSPRNHIPEEPQVTAAEHAEIPLLRSKKLLGGVGGQYPLGLWIDRPQFNLNDVANSQQTLFTSQSSCLVAVEKDLLEYDQWAVDPRITVRVVFEQLDLLAVAHERVEEREGRPVWIGGGESEQVFQRILRAGGASFVKRFFRFGESVCDFSVPVQGGLRGVAGGPNVQTCKGWGGEKRNQEFLIDINKFESSMDSKNYQNFLRLVGFVVETFVKAPQDDVPASKKHNDTLDDSKIKNMMTELHQLGKEGLMNHFEQQLRLTENQILHANSGASLFEVNLTNVKLQLLKDGAPRYEFAIQEYMQSTEFEHSGRTEVRYKTKSLEILNYQQDSPDKNQLLRRISQQIVGQDMLSIHQVYYTVKGKQYDNKWDVYRNFEIFLAPMILKLTQDMYSFMMEFFFSKDTAKEPPKLVDEVQQTSLKSMVDAEPNPAVGEPRHVLQATEDELTRTQGAVTETLEAGR